MNDYPNIEIINFEALNNEDLIADCPNLYENDVLNYFIDKYNLDYITPNYQNASDSLKHTTSNCSQNDSISSYNSEMSYYSESFQIGSQLNLSEESEKSFYSYDNRNDSKISISKSFKRGRLFACNACDKVYKSKENQTLHYKNIHLKLKPYNCRYCSSVFSHRNGKKF
jgi:hypothetical protein